MRNVPKKNGKKQKNEKKKNKGKTGPKESHQSRVFFWFQTTFQCVIGFIKSTKYLKKKRQNKKVRKNKWKKGEKW